MFIGPEAGLTSNKKPGNVLRAISPTPIPSQRGFRQVSRKSSLAVLVVHSARCLGASVGPGPAVEGTEIASPLGPWGDGSPPARPSGPSRTRQGIT